MTSKARAAFNLKFETEVDPNGELTADERARRAEHARLAYMKGLSLKAAKARRLAAVSSATEAGER